jgi:hypothetical protein
MEWNIADLSTSPPWALPLTGFMIALCLIFYLLLCKRDKEMHRLVAAGLLAISVLSLFGYYLTRSISLGKVQLPDLWWLSVLITAGLGLLARAHWQQHIAAHLTTEGKLMDPMGIRASNALTDFAPLAGFVLAGLVISYLLVMAKLSDHNSSWGELLPGLRWLSATAMLTCAIQAVRAWNRDCIRQPAIDGTDESESGLEGFAATSDLCLYFVGFCVSAIVLGIFFLLSS